MKFFLTLTALLLFAGLHAQTDSVYTKVQIHAFFPGGPVVRDFYFKKYGLQAVDDSSANTAIVSMIVEKNKHIRDIVILNAAAINEDLKKQVQKAFKTPPPYMAAIQNGQNVTSRLTVYLQSISN